MVEKNTRKSAKGVKFGFVQTTWLWMRGTVIGRKSLKSKVELDKKRFDLWMHGSVSKIEVIILKFQAWAIEQSNTLVKKINGKSQDMPGSHLLGFVVKRMGTDSAKRAIRCCCFFF